MTSDPGNRLGRWREQPPSFHQTRRSRALKWARLAALSAAMLAIVAGIVVTFTFLVRPTPRPGFVAYWIGAYQNPQVPRVPCSDADRQALRVGELFTWHEPTASSRPTKEVLQASLAGLRDDSATGVRIIFLSTYAVVGPEGTVQLLAVDSDPSRPQTLVPLGDVLDAVRRCPSQKKLLILDIMRPLDFPGAPALVRVADRVLGEIRSRDDGVMVLGACGPGEVPLDSEMLGRSVFLHELQLGLGGAADLNRDGMVAVRELSVYLRDHVDEWARRNWGRRQRPFLVGPSDDDFVLTYPDNGRASRPRALAGSVKGPVAASNGKSTAKSASRPAAKPADDIASGSRYPDWLAEGWALRDAWWTAGDFGSAPRVFRRLEAALFRAEREWRVGGDPGSIRVAFEEEARRLQREFDRARAVPRPATRSVGQWIEFGGRDDPELAAALEVALKRLREIDPAVKPEQRAAAVSLAAQPFVEKLRGRTGLELAGAVVACMADGRFDAETLRFLDRVTRESTHQTEVVELRFLRQLAERIEAAPGDWLGENAPLAEETARLAWTVVGLAERVNNRPGTFSRVHSLLTEADTRRHLGVLLLSSRAAGLASWAQVQAVWQEANARYARIEEIQRKIGEAQRVAEQALAMLPAYTTYLDASDRPALDDAWLELSRRTAELVRRLAVPREKSVASHDMDMARAGVEASDPRLEIMSHEVDRLAQLLETLRQPFQPPQLAELVNRAAESRPSPEVFAEINAILSVPFVDAATRVKLWLAGQDLARRLEAEPSRQRGAGADPEDDDAEPRERAIRRGMAKRALRAIALLRLAGREWPDSIPPDETRRAELGQATLTAWWDLDASAGAPAEWVAPAFRLDPGEDPEGERRKREALAAWGWLADHYRYEGRDLGDPDRFYEVAALDGPRVGELPRDELVVIVPEASGSTEVLSAARPRIDVPLSVLPRESGPADPGEAEIAVLRPGDDRLRVTFENLPTRDRVDPQSPFARPSVLTLSARAPTPVKMRLEWDDSRGDDRPSSPCPTGLLLEVRRAGGRAFHVIIPLRILQEKDRPRLLLSDNKSFATERPFEVRLRPGIGRVPFFLFVRNPAPRSRELAVEIVQGETAIPGGTAALTVPAGGTAQVATLGAPAPKPGDPLPELAGPLSIRLRDPSSGQELDRKTLRAVIASPLEYVLVADARYIPAFSGRPNQLSVILKALPEMIFPDCPVELVLSRSLIPSLKALPADARLAGKLEPGGDLTLLARQISLDPAQSPEGSFYLEIDGRKRALEYRTTFAPNGGERVVQRETRPRVWFEAAPILTPNQPARIKVRFEVDNAPPGAKLEFRMLGVDTASPDDIPRWVGDTERRHVGFHATAGEGALVFEATIADWEKEFETRNIRGVRLLRARLLDAGKELASHERPLLLDDLPPQDVVLGPLPLAIRKGTPTLEVQASVVPPVSGVKEVTFFVGKPADLDKVQAAGLIARARPEDSGRRMWSAHLELPASLSGKLDVTVRCVSGAGLASFDTATIDVAEPRGNAKASETKLSNEPGGIRGTVIQGGLPQPNLSVVLKDEKGAEVARTKTAKDGSYEFETLTPGKYRVSSSNEASLTTATATITVEAGTITQAKPLELYR